MLLTYIAEIYLIIISLCFTFAEPFNDIFLFFKSSCALVSGNTNKSLRPKDRPTDRASEFALAHLTPILHFCKIVVKMVSCALLQACYFQELAPFSGLATLETFQLQ